MKKITVSIVFVLVVCFVFSNMVAASRIWDEKLTPEHLAIVADGVTYIPAYEYYSQERKISFLEARDATTNKLLWRQKVYEVPYIRGLEDDVQDIPITSLRIENGSVIVENQTGEVYAVDIESHKVTVLKKETEKEACVRLGGKWGLFGEFQQERCNEFAWDQGKTCKNDSDCQGDCIAELTKEQWQRVQRGETIITDGKCSQWTLNYGCEPFVSDGKVEGILCRD